MSGATPTRIPLIDGHMGGLLPGRAYFVFGEPGTGKSLLGLQFALGGVAQGEGAIYVAMERPGALLSLSAGLGGVDPTPAIDAGALVLLEYDRDDARRVARHGWRPFLDRLHAIEATRPVRKIVFDTIQPLFAEGADERHLRRDVRDLVKTLSEWDRTVLFLNDSGGTAGHPSIRRVFSEMCVGVFELRDAGENLASTRSLLIHKLRQPSDGLRKIAFEIVAGRGIAEPRDVALRSRGIHAERTKGREAVDRVQWLEAGERPKVLVADADPFFRLRLKKGLREHFEVILAGDGAQALMLTLQERPQVLLLDVALPSVTGFEVCRSLRSNGFSRPILFVSRRIDPREQVRGLSLGADGFLSKAFRLPEAVRKVSTAGAFERRPAFTERHRPDFDTLLRAARARSLSPEEFREKLETARATAARFAASIGFARIQCRGAASAQIERLRELLERDARPEDLVTHRSEESFVALPGENANGVVAYLRKLRRLGTFAGREGASEFPANVTVTFHAVCPSAETRLDLESVWRSAESPRLLFADSLFESRASEERHRSVAGASG